jgi:hypothetical protein
MAKKITKRTGSKTQKNSTQTSPKIDKFDAERLWRDHERRLKNIEVWMANKVDEEASIALRLKNGQIAKLPKKRGPKPKYPATIYRDWDLFVSLFESYWPEIEPMCGPTANMEGLKRILTALKAQEVGQIAEAAQQLLDRLPFIKEFFANPRLRARFRSDPRVLAGALAGVSPMAGVPGVGLWRSLKLCPPESCKVRMNDRSVRSYIRRKNLPLHQTLDAGIDLLGLISWLKEHRTRDKTLKQYSAQRLMDAWKAGVDNSSQLFKTQEIMKSRWMPVDHHSY